ncbi:MAG: hypothetical protein F4X20_08885 [Dehalococcoidia bacterium]|nr:hypothetical protein [Dehalococcoidia bacterium]
MTTNERDVGQGSDQRLSRTNQNLWNAFIGHARAKRLYNAYASKAVLDGYPEVAEAFLRVARDPDIFPVNVLSSADELRSTRENLQSVVDSHTYDVETLYPRIMAEAEAEGRSDVVGRIRLAIERDERDLAIFREALEGAGWGTDTVSVEESPAQAEHFVDEEMARATESIDTARERITALGRIREVIFGMQDGLISTAVLVSSVYAATQDSFVTVVAGLAGGLGGVVSMATGSYLGSQAESEVKLAEIDSATNDFHESRSEVVARLVVLLRNEGLSEDAAVLIAETLAQNERALLNTVIEKELGLSADVDTVPWKDAFAMGASFFLGAAVPIIPYLIAAFNMMPGMVAVWTSIAGTAVGLFLMGAGKTRFTLRNPVTSGLEMLAIGVVSAILGYALGALITFIFDVQV